MFALIALYILGALVLIILVLLLLPITACVEFCDNFSVKIKLAGIKIFPIEKNRIKKKNSQSREPSKESKDTEDKAKNLFEALKKEKGLIGAVKEILNFLKSCLEHFKWVLKFVSFRKVMLNLNVASDSAADTAVMYGGVCAVVYPFLSFFDSVANVKYKQINIKSDFDVKKSTFNFSLNITLNIIFLLILAFKVYKDYKNFIVRNGLQ